MRCIDPRPGTTRNGIPCRYPCGQCTACRVRVQSSWTLRNLLESKSGISAQSWTLTLDEKWVHLAEQPEKLVKNFFNALRMRHRRMNIGLPIRYFGCHEYGGMLGRPHFHFLIYNSATLLPQDLGRHHLPSWPHGHCEQGPYGTASIRYVTEYLLEPSWTGEKPQSFQSLKPGIGSCGLVRLGALAGSKRMTLSAPPSALAVGSRTYPLDRWMAGQFLYGFRKAGGLFRIPTKKELLDRYRENLLVETHMPEHIRLTFARNLAELVARRERAKDGEAERFQKVVEAARAKAAYDEVQSGVAPD